MGWCDLPPERVKRTVNTKKETNSRVKVGQETKWAQSQNGPRVKMDFCYYPLKESNWAKGQDELLLFTP